LDNPAIYGLMACILADCEPVAKDARNEFGNYSYRSLDSIVATVRTALAKHGVVSIPEVISQERHQYETAKGTPMHVSLLTMRTTFYAPDGSSVSAVTIGEGADSGDKATNKALSSAQKYALLQTFLLGAGVDADAETPAVVGAKVGRRQEPRQPSTAAASPPPEEGRGVSSTPPREGSVPAWWGEVTGFGKKDRSKTLSIDKKPVPIADLTWAMIAGGKPGGGRHSWLVDTLAWAQQQEKPGTVIKLFLERGRHVAALYDRAMQQEESEPMSNDDPADAL